jgi:hypothetical protein
MSFLIVCRFAGGTIWHGHKGPQTLSIRPHTPCYQLMERGFERHGESIFLVVSVHA